MEKDNDLWGKLWLMIITVHTTFFIIISTIKITKILFQWQAINIFLKRNWNNEVMRYQPKNIIPMIWNISNKTLTFGNPFRRDFGNHFGSQSAIFSLTKSFWVLTSNFLRSFHFPLGFILPKNLHKNYFLWVLRNFQGFLL